MKLARAVFEVPRLNLFSYGVLCLPYNVNILPPLPPCSPDTDSFIYWFTVAVLYLAHDNCSIRYLNVKYHAEICLSKKSL